MPAHMLTSGPAKTTGRGTMVITIGSVTSVQGGVAVAWSVRVMVPVMISAALGV